MKTVAKWALAALAVCAAQAFAADYPTKPVRFIEAFPPGSATDIVGRLYTQKWTEMWGHQVIADNRAGAGGSIAGAIAIAGERDAAQRQQRLDNRRKRISRRLKSNTPHR